MSLSEFAWIRVSFTIYLDSIAAWSRRQAVGCRAQGVGGRIVGRGMAAEFYIRRTRNISWPRGVQAKLAGSMWEAYNDLAERQVRSCDYRLLATGGHEMVDPEQCGHLREARRGDRRRRPRGSRGCLLPPLPVTALAAKQKPPGCCRLRPAVALALGHDPRAGGRRAFIEAGRVHWHVMEGNVLLVIIPGRSGW